MATWRRSAHRFKIRPSGLRALTCVLRPEVAGQRSYNQYTMKNSEIIFAVEDSAEGGYEAHALGRAIVTQADSIEDPKAMVRDAVRCHFEDDEMSAIVYLHFVHDEVISA